MPVSRRRLGIYRVIYRPWTYAIIRGRRGIQVLCRSCHSPVRTSTHGGKFYDICACPFSARPGHRPKEASA